MKLLARMTLIAACLLLPASAYAFPAPDLVINLFGSGAQLLGMLTAGAGASWLGFARRRQGRPAKAAGIGFFLMAGLLLCSLGLNLWQYWQHAELQARRLQTGLLRASPPTHPIQPQQALERDEFQRWLEQGHAYQLIDVREPEEFELGRIPGAKHSRYADLLSRDQALLHTSVENVLVCDSGYRSGEICAALSAAGIPCRYIAGGYAKWVAEARPMEAVRAGHGPGLQALPRYRRDQTLLETAQVDRLVKQHGARFIDVRPPAEFAQGHLPSAINLPVREQPSAALDAALANLPQVPIIAACYDNRSCFYSKVVGLRLTRRGADYRGRYTLPQEYPIPQRLAESLLLRHLSQWSEQAMAWLSAPPRQLLDAAQALRTGPGGAILLLAMLVRMLAAPASLLQERDRRRMRQLRSQRQQLRQRYAGDVDGERRAWQRLVKRDGVRPLRNFMLGLLQILLLTGCVAAVHEMAQQIGGTDSVHAAWADPSRYHALPLLLAIAIVIYLAGLMQAKRWWRWPAIVLPALAVGYQTQHLSAAVNFYLLASLVITLLQQMLMRYWWIKSLRQRKRGRRKSAALVQPLLYADALAGAGAKAVALGRMLDAGLPVPQGFGIDAAAWRSQDHALKGKVQAQLRAALLRFTLFGLKKSTFAVRSAARGEDSQEQSQAGRYLTMLHVTAAGLRDAIDAVSLSCSEHDPTGQGTVIVQEMVDAEYAGVLFTEEPTGSGGMLLEMAAGAGAVVGGCERPYACIIGRVSGVVPSAEASPIPLTPLWQLAQRVETLFGAPQDLEWAYSKGRYYLLQARPITRRIVAADGARALREQERSRLLALAAAADIDAEAGWLLLDDVAAELPHASASSLSLLQAVHAPGGSVDLAWRRLGLSYDEESMPNWITAFGHTRLQSSRRTVRLKPSLLTQLRFARKADLLARAFLQDFLPAFRQQMRLRAALELSRLQTGELLALLPAWRDEFVKQVYVEAELITVTASLYDQTARRLLEKRGLSPAVYLRPEHALPEMRAMQMLIAVREGRVTMEEFLHAHGHRTAHDFELVQARQHETPESLMRQLQQLPATLLEPAALAELPKGVILGAAVARARRYLSLKEEAKHECVRALDQLRRLMLELDTRLNLDGGIFVFSLDEVAAFTHPLPPSWREELAARNARAAAFADTFLPDSLSVVTLERMDLSGRPQTVAAHDGQLSGIRVAGSGLLTAAACVLHDPADAGRFKRGAILVIATADPAWIKLFPLAAGVVCETGGWLCHAAIMAREFSVPAIFGARGALAAIRDGDRLGLHDDGRIDVVRSSQDDLQKIA